MEVEKKRIQRKNRTYYRITNKYILKFRGSVPGIVISGWIFQGFLYMNRYEKMYKIALELVLLFVCYFTFFFLVNSVGFLQRIFWSLVTAHTLMWFLNGQVMTMLIHMNLFPNQPAKFIKHTNRLARNMRSKRYIDGAAAFGGLTRYEFKTTSDLDLRVVMKAGIINQLRACHFCFLERVKALFYVYPIDIFAFDLDTLIERMNTSEKPIIMYDPRGKLRSAYPRAVLYDDFSVGFSKKFL